MGKIKFNASDLPVIQENQGQTFVKQEQLDKMKDAGIIPRARSIIYSKKTLENPLAFEQFLKSTNLLDIVKTKKAKSVFIKPNLMTYISPDGLNYTNITLLRAVCDYLKDYNPVIIESNMFYSNVFPKHSPENVAKALKINFAPVQNLSTMPTIEREFKGRKYAISKVFEDPSKYCLINMPILKGHPIFHFTCCVKNLYGLFPEPDKIWHFHHEQDINDAIIAVNHLIHSDFTIIDAIRCQDKLHDLLTTALPKKLAGYYYDYRFLFASENPLALDNLVKDLLGVTSDCVLDALQEIYPSEYDVTGDLPLPLRGFKISGIFRRFLWKRLTELPYTQKILHTQLRNIFRKLLSNPKYLFDRNIFQLEC